MNKGRKFMAVLTASMLISSIPLTAFGAVIVNNSDSSEESSVEKLLESGKMTLEEIAALGPSYAEGIAKYIDDSGNMLLESIEEGTNTNFDGPGVSTVTLGEIYHEEYETYELSIADMFFLYSNIGNGGLTHESVMIDIPANVSYTMEKDGLPYEYVSRTHIWDKGTYVLRLTAIENPDEPYSEQKEYQAVFRFRIQDPPPMDPTEEELLAALSENVEEITPPVIENDTESNTENNLDEVSAMIPDEITETIENPEEESPTVDSLVEIVSERSQNYNAVTGEYEITLENGMKLRSSVPEGYVGGGAVTLSVSEEDVAQVELYRDDELIEFVNGQGLTEAGSYRMELGNCAYHFTMASAVNTMEYYPVPTGVAFTEVLLNGEPVALESEDYILLNEGVYEITMRGTAGNQHRVTLTKDTTAPVMTILSDGSKASFTELSEELSSIRLIRNGEVVEDFNSTVVSEPGNYVVTIADAAGNESTQSFTLKYKVNLYGILAGVLCVLVVIGIGVFTVYIKKHTKVR